MYRTDVLNAFEFVVVAGLRAHQLARGCTPRVNGAHHKKTRIAQDEVLAGKVTRSEPASPTVGADSGAEVPPREPAAGR